MKRNKKIILLLAALICVSLAAFGVSRYEKQKEIIKNSDEIIMEVANEDVNVLSWKCDKGSFAFHKDGDGNWIYDTDEAFPVDGEKIKKMLEQFQEFGVSFIIEKVEDFGQYGLDKPVCTIHMETKTKTYEISLGDYSAMDSERYVSIGDGNVYLVKHDPLEQFGIEISDVIKHDEIPQMDAVGQIQFTGAESEKIVYEEKSKNTYYAEDVYFVERDAAKMPLDTTRVNDYLDTIKKLDLKDYATYNATEKELQEYGMDAPELSVVIDYTVNEEKTKEKTKEKTAGTLTLHVGRDPKERKEAPVEKAADSESEDAKNQTGEEEKVTAYARVGDSKIVYRITAEQYKKLMDMSYDSLRHQEMFWADFKDMRQLDIVLEGKTYTITSKMEDDARVYYYNEEKLEMEDIQNAIKGLKATDFTDKKPAEKEEISFTVYLDNENYPEVHIQLYRHDGDSCIAVVDGNPTAFVERAKVVDLMEAVNSVVLD